MTWEKSLNCWFQVTLVQYLFWAVVFVNNTTMQTLLFDQNQMKNQIDRTAESMEIATAMTFYIENGKIWYILKLQMQRYSSASSFWILHCVRSFWRTKKDRRSTFFRKSWLLLAIFQLSEYHRSSVRYFDSTINFSSFVERLTSFAVACHELGIFLSSRCADDVEGVYAKFCGYASDYFVAFRG